MQCSQQTRSLTSSQRACCEGQAPASRPAFRRPQVGPQRLHSTCLPGVSVPQWGRARNLSQPHGQHLDTEPPQASTQLSPHRCSRRPALMRPVVGAQAAAARPASSSCSPAVGAASSQAGPLVGPAAAHAAGEACADDTVDCAAQLVTHSGLQHHEQWVLPGASVSQVRGPRRVLGLLPGRKQQLIEAGPWWTPSGVPCPRHRMLQAVLCASARRAAPPDLQVLKG